ncbi:MAG: lmo0937 family membrane protein [Pyrinomonadaceae bacterium]
MLETVIIILLILWLLGLVNGIAGGFIHLVLLVALIIFAVRFITSRKTV